MAAVEVLTFAFLIFQVNSQMPGLGPTYVIRGFEPNVPCGTEIYQPTMPGGTLQALPNLVSLSEPITLSQPCLNVPASPNLDMPVPSSVQNQVPLINQPFISPVPSIQPSVNNVLASTNVQMTPVVTNTPQPTPSVIANPATQPVMTVVDNTLANSLANALQLLIISNLLENTGTDNFAQNPPCINNYEIVTPDFAVPAVPCEYFSNVVYPETIVSIPEPVFACPEPTLTIPEPVVSSLKPVVYQSYPTNFGGALSAVDNSGFYCGPNQVFLGSPTQYAPACSDFMSPIPAVAEIAPMAIEVPFPSSIPAQLTCNFGFLPSNQPCVSFNVEPCNNVFGNF